MTHQCYIGIDPGDRWIGVAMLRITREVYYAADTFVIDGNQRNNLVARLNDILPGQRFFDVYATSVITEEYRQRPVGHQRFHSSLTSQLIGAIRYVTEKWNGHWSEVPAGDPDKELPQLIIGDYLDRWRLDWPEPKNPAWHHGRAAWRILARYLLVTNAKQLTTLRRSSLPLFSLTPIRMRSVDLYAPTCEWKL